MGKVFTELLKCGYKVWQKGSVIRIYINTLIDIMDFKIDENNFTVEGVDFRGHLDGEYFLDKVIWDCRRFNLYVDFNDRYFFSAQDADEPDATILGICLERMFNRINNQPDDEI